MYHKLICVFLDVRSPDKKYLNVFALQPIKVLYNNIRYFKQ